MSIALVRYEPNNLLYVYDERKLTLFWTGNYPRRDWEIVNWTADTVTMRRKSDNRIEVLNEKGQIVSSFY